jgi:hypothetical protein
MVPLVGLEPTRLAALDFESSASTNSTTGALRLVIAAGGMIFKQLHQTKENRPFLEAGKKLNREVIPISSE